MFNHICKNYASLLKNKPLIGRLLLMYRKLVLKFYDPKVKCVIGGGRINNAFITYVANLQSYTTFI